MNEEIVSYSIVQTTRVAAHFNGERLVHEKFERLAYHYLSIDHAMEHMDWAREQFVAQSKEGNTGFSLVTIEISVKTWNDTQHRMNPPLEKFVFLDGEEVPTGGRTFKSI